MLLALAMGMRFCSSEAAPAFSGHLVRLVVSLLWDDLDSPMGCLLRGTVACGSGSGSSFCGIHFPAAGRCASSGGSLPAIIFLDGGGGQRMPVFTHCGDGRCAWEAIFSALSHSSKSSSAVSILWTSSLVWMTAIALAPADCFVRNRGRRCEDPETRCGGSNYQFLMGLFCNRSGLYYSPTV